MLANLLTYVRTNNTVDIMARDVLGNNVPHVLITRNKDEMVDQAMGQFGNSLLFYGGGWLFDKCIVLATKRAQKSLAPLQRKWFAFGKSMAIYTFLGSLMVASAQLRNALTTYRTGKTKYTDMIGETDLKKNDPQARKREIDESLSKAAKDVGIGMAIIGAITAGTVGLLAVKPRFPALLQKISTKFLLQDGKFAKMPDYGDVFCGAGAAYLGWFLASRDQFETKELLFRFGGFLLSFIILPRAAKNILEKKLPATVGKTFGSVENAAYVGKLATAVTLCTSLPSLVNIYLTRQRVAKAGLNRVPPKISLRKSPTFSTFERYKNAPPTQTATGSPAARTLSRT